jgi:hypothetical protein
VGDWSRASQLQSGGNEKFWVQIPAHPKNYKKRRLAARACDDSIVSSMEGISNGEVMVRDLLDYDVPWLKHRTYKKYAKD